MWTFYVHSRREVKNFSIFLEKIMPLQKSRMHRLMRIAALLKDLKKQGVWVFGTAPGGTTSLYNADL